MKNFQLWAIGDLLTKVGCGIFGGGTVYFVSTHSLNVYSLTVLVGAIVGSVGYVLIGLAGCEKP